MEYFEKYSVANPMHDTYVQYMESLAVFVRWLLDNDYDVKLLLGDADADPWPSTTSGPATGRLASNFDGRVTDHRSTPSKLLSQLSATDLVVATRFHNVLMSLLLSKPVIAISFHHKCSSLMSEMGLSEYCQDINQMTRTPSLRSSGTGQERRRCQAEDPAASRDVRAPWTSSTSFSSVTYRPARALPQQRLRRDGTSSPKRARDAVGERGAEAVLRRASRGTLKVNRHLAASRLACAICTRSAYGRWLHALTSRTPTARMYVGNAVSPEPAALEADAPRFAERPQRSSVRVAVLGCSVGVEFLLDPVDAASGAPGSDDPRRCWRGHLTRGLGDRRRRASTALRPPRRCTSRYSNG
jgi:hypothetical protein